MNDVAEGALMLCGFKMMMNYEIERDREINQEHSLQAKEQIKVGYDEHIDRLKKQMVDCVTIKKKLLEYTSLITQGIQTSYSSSSSEQEEEDSKAEIK